MPYDDGAPVITVDVTMAVQENPLIPRGGPAHRFVLETFARTGRSPTLDDVRRRFHLATIEQADALVAELERAGCVHRNAGDSAITHAYPFSNERTAHRVQLSQGPELYAMCAIDALGMPFMLGKDAEIASACASCSGAVSIAVAQGSVNRVSPAGLVVWYAKVEAGCVLATALCPDLNFFCSTAHLQKWTAAHPDKSGDMITFDQALARGRQVFENLLQDAGES